MPDFQTSRDTLNEIAERLKRQEHSGYAGAQFRIALARADERLKFVTGFVLLRQDHIPSRVVADYGTLLLLERWIAIDDVLDFFAKLLSGQAEMEGHKISDKFSNSRLDAEPHPRGSELWSGWRFSSYCDRDPNEHEVQLGHQPLLAFGLQPFSSPGHAIRRWMFEEPRIEHYDSSVPNLGQLITFLPDTRARIIKARWTPGKLVLVSESRISEERLQYQIVQHGSESEFQIMRGVVGEATFEIPEDTRELVIYMFDKDGGFITRTELRALYETIGFEDEEATDLDAHLLDLSRGEGDSVEYKPFMQPNNDKESEFVESVIAFANTNGGKVYVGVQDRDGKPYGRGELRKIFSKYPDPVQAQRDQLRWLVSNKVKPIPSFHVEAMDAFGEPVLVVSIERNDAICSTHDNQIWVRHGATNYRPDAQNELRRLLLKNSLEMRL
ncbi:MAG: putative transcriptional regulator [Acidobacteriales bacterium]|nr:putative transcriptional regulator [Terriglobales bacterium]